MSLASVQKRFYELMGQPCLPQEFDFQKEVLLDGQRYQIFWCDRTDKISLLRVFEKLVQLPREVRPLIAAPFMGEVGREQCEARGLSWLDLSGNASLLWPGVRVLILGYPNKHKQRGRPTNLFSPKRARLIKALLMNQEPSGQGPLSQRALSHFTGLDEGYVSKICRSLLDAKLIQRDASKRLYAHDPELLLSAWRERYELTQHQIVKGHIPTRSGDELTAHITSALQQLNRRYALTGLAAAQRYEPFSTFRTVSVYLGLPLGEREERALSFHQEDRGANVWLICPKDEGVWLGAQRLEGVHVVHPLQVYLDLKDHPERSFEVAEHLKERRLSWRGVEDA